jgi:response regulator RpfG family c-di-GMP phosphodiesterase
MRLLLVEDEIDTALKFSDCAKSRTDIKFVGMTDSCEEGLKLVKSKLPEGVILDLQLVKGKGSGLEFLEALHDMELTLRPLIVVTTSNPSDTVQKYCEAYGADFFFCKSQQDYCEEFVIKTLLQLRRVLDHKQKKKPLAFAVHTDLQKSREMVETPDDRRDRIYNRIDVELDLVGLRARLKGRNYIREAIYFQIHSDKDRGSGIEEVAAKFNYTYASIIKTMQTAINDAWDSGDIEEILQHFTARVTSRSGVPYVSDFIHFYALYRFQKTDQEQCHLFLL